GASRAVSRLRSSQINPAPRNAPPTNAQALAQAIDGADAPRQLPGQTSQSPGALGGAILGGGAGYALAPEDQKDGAALVAAILGGIGGHNLSKSLGGKPSPAGGAYSARQKRPAITQSGVVDPLPEFPASFVGGNEVTIGKTDIEYLVGKDGSITIETMWTPHELRGAGEASRALDEILRVADRDGRTVRLQVDEF